MEFGFCDLFRKAVGLVKEKAKGLVGKLVEKSKDFADGAIDSMGEFLSS